jgi:hypothetical protein
MEFYGTKSRARSHKSMLLELMRGLLNDFIACVITWRKKAMKAKSVCVVYRSSFSFWRGMFFRIECLFAKNELEQIRSRI